MTSQEITQFIDEGIQQEVSVPVLKDSINKVGQANDVSLGSWLQRPLEIANFSWTTGSQFTTIFDPWTLFLSDPRNVNKIAYYNNLRCKNLCLKFLINGGPFLYGRVMVSYLPFDTDQLSQVRDTTSFYVGQAPDNEATLITHSHRPHILLDPTLSQGGCFELPFLWYKNWIEIGKEQWRMLGRVSMQSFGALSSAGGTASTTIKIKVFAWMNEPDMCVPTTLLPTLPAQSTAGDEYVGLVSKPASAVAAIAGKLSKFPVIGGYARATEIAAGAGAEMAKLMGFSRPNVLTPLQPIRPTYVNDIAVVDKPEYVIKITTDSKQELSIASESFGIDSGDPYSISGLVGRETYLCRCIWAVGAEEGTNLFSSLVTPMLYGLFTPSGYTTNKQMVSTAMSYGAFPFRWWKGNVKFRFQLVASQYHRGRVKIVYDLSTQPIATKSNSVYSRIIDIQETTDFTVTVGWNNPALMAEVQPATVTFSQNWSVNSIPFSPNSDYHNGSLTMFVENELSVPIPGVSADVQWLVWVSLENPVFNEPSSAIQQVTPSSPFVATVGEETEGDATSSLTIGDIGIDANLNQVVFGETITSYRSLLRRYVDYNLAAVNGLSATVFSYINMVLRDYPLYPGSDSSGIHATSSAVKTNFVGMTFVNYIAMAHSMYRGGIRYKFHNVSSAPAFRPMEFIRYPTTASSTAMTATALGSVNGGNSYAASSNSLGNAWLGAAITDASRSPFLEVEAPYWCTRRFDNPKYYSDNSKVAQASQLLILPFSGTSQLVLKTYLAAAEDFQVCMYTGPPNLWLSSYNVY